VIYRVPIRSYPHIHQGEQGHGGLTFLTLVAVLIISISALLLAVSSSEDVTDAQDSVSSVESKMAEAQAEMDSNLRSLQELGAAVDQLQGRLAQAMTRPETMAIQADLRSALATLEASIARTRTDLTALKANVSRSASALTDATDDIALEQIKVATLERSLATLQNAFNTTAAEATGNQALILALEDALEQTLKETDARLAYATVGNVFLIWWNHGLVGKETVTQEVDLAVAATEDAELQTAWEAVRTAQTSFSASPTGLGFQVLIRETDPFLELLAKKLVYVNAP